MFNCVLIHKLLSACLKKTDPAWLNKEPYNILKIGNFSNLFKNVQKQCNENCTSPFYEGKTLYKEERCSVIFIGRTIELVFH